MPGAMGQPMSQRAGLIWNRITAKAPGATLAPGVGRGRGLRVLPAVRRQTRRTSHGLEG